MIRVINSWTTTILFLLMMMVFVFNLKLASEYLMDSYRPFEYWVLYGSVKSAKNEYETGEIIEMISERAVYKDVKTNWIDVLYCKRDFDEEYKRFSQADTGGSIMRKADYKKYRWLYAGRQPQGKARCYMISDIIIDPSPFIEKIHTVESNTFVVNSDGRMHKNREMLSE